MRRTGNFYRNCSSFEDNLLLVFSDILYVPAYVLACLLVYSSAYTVYVNIPSICRVTNPQKETCVIRKCITSLWETKYDFHMWQTLKLHLHTYTVHSVSLYTLTKRRGEIKTGRQKVVLTETICVESLPVLALPAILVKLTNNWLVIFSGKDNLPCLLLKGHSR